MLSFLSDYTEGAHPQVLKKLTETNMISLPGYGVDEYCEMAKDKIRKACHKDDLDVHFLVGGTQTNLVVIASMLLPFQGVLSASTGHINVHEAGAVEYTGHKILELPQHDGKVKAADVKEYMERFYGDDTHDHMVFPGMLYISHPTELGTLYSKQELHELSAVCRSYDLPIFMDGARLGYGLVSPEADVTIDDVVECCDVFYIGGTKVGALCGEAVVFTKNNTPRQFVTMTKQHGAMLAKGRVLGVQFDALFTDDLYYNISKHAIAMAMELKAAFVEKGYELFIDSPTNQQFVVINKAQLERLREKVAFNVWEKQSEDRIVVRFVTSWATRPEAIEELKALL